MVFEELDLVKVLVANDIQKAQNADTRRSAAPDYDPLIPKVLSLQTKGMIQKPKVTIRITEGSTRVQK